MTQEQQQRVEQIYGKDYSRLDVPPQLRGVDMTSEYETQDWAEMHGVYTDPETGELDV